MGGEAMKIDMKRLIRDEKGAAMVLAVILLLVGGLIAAPLLAHMGTGVIAGEVYARRTAELYAADAGVEDAMWKIQHRVDVPSGGCNDTSRSYNISDVNGRSVHVTIDYQDGGTYRITSIAATDDGGGTAAISGTEIEAYVTGVSANFSGLLDNVITSQNEIDYPPEQNLDINYPEGHGPVEYYTGLWPTPEDLDEFYWPDVAGEPEYGSGTIDLNGVDRDLGPLYRNGKLDIKNTSDTPATLTLTGTLYITGDTQIYGPTGNDPLKLTLDLNGHTIFVASNSTKYALEIKKCNIIGPGCIIAVGDVYFAPNIPVGMTDPIFIMSVSGTTNLQPGGVFYGAIAGSIEVDLQPNTSLNYPESGFEGLINFPGFVEPNQLIYSIESWEVSQL